MQRDLIIAVITATILFFLFAVFIVIYFLVYRRKQKQHKLEMDSFKKEFEQQLLHAQVEVQESTYRHIAQELHDNVGQLLSTTKMLMGVTELKLGQVPDTLNTANATLTKAIEELRLLSRSLDKEWLEQFNFLDNLQNEIDHINSSQTIRASVACHTTIHMQPDEQIILFRMVQEAMQNAIRHAQPTRIDVEIHNSQQLVVKVYNDGKPLPQAFQGMGTNNMRHRAQLFGGTVQWQSLNQQTVVTISIPLKTPHAN